MANPREPTITVENVEGWHAHLEDFKRVAYPILAEHGLSIGEALILWELNKITNALRDINDRLEAQDSE
jgi:hypothetical protein